MHNAEILPYMLINVCNQLLMLQYEKETGWEWGNKNTYRFICCFPPPPTFKQIVFKLCGCCVETCFE